MKYEIVSFDKITIAGISVRTNNTNGKSQKDIAQLWATFMQSNIAQEIPNKVSEDIFCVYTDYESDFMGEYATIIGFQVSNTNGIPAEFTIKEISASKYRKYTSQGTVPECVGETWMHIWTSDIDRRYSADFDVYGKESQNGDNSIVTTYLSIN